jgi:VanZ family protein
MAMKMFWKPICWAILIGVLSFMPVDDFNSQKWFNFQHQDKILHLLFYGFLSFLLFRSISTYLSKSKPGWLIYLLTFLIILFYGLMIEIIQDRFTATRQGDIIDMLFDLAGYFIAMIIVLLIPSLRISPKIKE